MVALTSAAGKLPAIEGVFLSASAASARPHAVQAVADGKELAGHVAAYLSGSAKAPQRRFAVRLGAVGESELRQLMGDAAGRPRTKPAEVGASFSPAEATAESERCMLCGCGSTDFCKLRKYASEYGAETARFRGDRRPITRNTTHEGVVFEEGKCISCGLCVAIARRAGEPMGLCFVGRGFAITVASPLGDDWSRALTQAAEEAIAVCPTGAIHRPEL